jgi:outer membrane immunogenic protein
MKVRIQGKLAMAAGAAAIFASAGIALADGMPGGPGYAGPGGWSGVYVGFESGVQWSNFSQRELVAHTTLSSTSDANVGVGIFLGYQHQFGPLVIGAELDLIGNQFDRPASTPCPIPAFSCQDKITDLITIGPRVGWALGRFMPYATGGYASGSVDYRAVLNSTGVAFDQADKRVDGWYAGGGVDWKLSRHAVLSIEYRHYDFVDTGQLNPQLTGGGPSGDLISTKSASDSVMVRGSLLFGGRDYAPLK